MPDNRSYQYEELIDWDEEKRKKFKDVLPSAKYGAASELLRHSISEATACSMFCKGEKCKYEDVVHWKEEEMEIKGLYSNWITKNILAMARPNTFNVEKFKIIEQFQKCGIQSIINLQLPGEHASCGHPLEPGGFSYNQQQFMDNGIFFYNFGWDDYGVGSLSSILDMVKVMQFAVSEGKVAIHCHAGLGRTGVLIACYLVFVNRMDPSEVIHYIRHRRPPSIQTKSQITYIQGFAEYLRPLRVVFSSNDKDDPATRDFTLTQFLTRQNHILHGFEARELKFVPKIIYECCNKLLRLVGRGKDRHHQHDTYNDLVETAPTAFRNLRQANQLEKDKNGALPSDKKLLKGKSISLESFTALRLETRESKTSLGLTNMPSYYNGDYSGSDSVPSSASVTPSLSRRDVNSERGNQFVGELTPDGVGTAMAQTEYDDEIVDKVESFKNCMNSDCRGYEKLQQVVDPQLLAKLMWDWLDQLKEPVLHAQDLPLMLEYCKDPTEGLKLISKGARRTVKLIFRTVARLEPLDEDVERSVVQRILSTLTHQNMVVEMDALMSPDKSILKRTSSDMGLMRSTVAGRMLYFFMRLLYLMQEELQERQEQHAARGQESDSGQRKTSKRDSSHNRSSKSKDLQD